jgi:hypothetical protein
MMLAHQTSHVLQFDGVMYCSPLLCTSHRAELLLALRTGVSDGYSHCDVSYHGHV